jgi:S1-C subfamily serine protease
VGITTASPEGSPGEGLSFATPIDTARDVAAQIILTGSAHHPWLGIEGSDVEARAADDLALEGGARVATVAEGSPADEAGLAPDDVITSVDADTITSMADLVVELRRHEPGALILITFLRDGRPGAVVAHLGERA